MGECNTSSLNYDFVPIKHTTDEIKWVGDAVDCLDVCSGARLTELEAAILEKLCELVETTDLDSVEIPSCLTAAWGTKDKDILTFVNFLLEQHCYQQEQIDMINGNDGVSSPYITLNTIFEVNYPECCGDNCIKGTSLKLADHLEKILLCLCETKAIAQEALNKAGDAKTLANSANTTANRAALTATTASENVTDTYAVLKAKINCIIEETGIASTCPLL